jgi:protein-tyrosine phosphatase
MIDTHCHLLPGVDDGPASTDEAVALARELVAQGVETVVCTPHWSSRFPTRHEDAAAAHSVLEDALRREQVPLELVLAAELSDAVAVTRSVDEVRRRSIASRWVIVELVERSLPLHVEMVVRRLEAAGLGTVLAHPERCKAVQDDPGALDGARAAGALVQLVAPSLTGRAGRKVRKTAWLLADTGRVDLVGSDAHDTGKRRCELEAAGDLVAKELGPERWSALTREAPGRLLEGEDPYDD